MNLAQNLASAFGKIFRIDPMGRNSGNGKYGVPTDNPMRARAGTLPEIYAYGIRNVQRLGWDSRNGAMYLSDIGQNVVEEVSPVTAGANLGWNRVEGPACFNDAECDPSAFVSPTYAYSHQETGGCSGQVIVQFAVGCPTW